MCIRDSDRTTRYVPELGESGYGANSLRDLLQMSSGVKFIEDYAAASSLEARAWVEGNITRSVRYGFGCLRTGLQYRLGKLGVYQPRLFAGFREPDLNEGA